MCHSKFTATVLLLAFLLTNGCATIFRGSTQDVSFTSIPDGATLKVDDVKRGETPGVVKLCPKEKPVVLVEKTGFAPVKVQTTSGVGGGWIVLAILTFPIGLIVDAVTGDWYGFDNKKFEVDIQKGMARPLDN